MDLSDFAVEFQTYLDNMEQARAKKQHHDYRRSLFVNFITKCFDVPNVEVDLEKNVRGTSFVGSIDALYKNIIFEFKRDLEDERDTGVAELTKYLMNLHRGENYFGILTDGTTFETYILKKDVLGKIDEVNFLKLSSTEVFLWIDSFLFATKQQIPTSEDIVERFGGRSFVFTSSSKILEQMFQSNGNDSSVKIKLKEWDRLLAKVYGSSVGSEWLFVRHTYLTMLAKVIAYLAIFQTRPKTRDELLGIISGENFRNRGFPNLVESDFFTWVLSPNLQDDTFNLLSGLAQHLSVYDLTKINEDLLKELYQGLVDPMVRHDLGEYYTPDWLAELTLKEAGLKKDLSMIDPACGSGTFLFTAIRMLVNQGVKGSVLVDWVTNSIVGMDVHPVAVTIARVNYVLALASELSGYTKNVVVPVYLADSLVAKVEISMMGDAVSVHVEEGEVFDIPKETAEHPEELDQIINELYLYALKPEDTNSKSLSRWH